MAELPPLPDSFWNGLWPVCARGDLVIDGVVFHPTRMAGAYEPHEMGFLLTVDQIRQFRLGPRALVDLTRERLYGK